MKNITYFLLLFASSLVLTSCSNNVYTSQEGNLLMLSEKGDAKLSVGAGISTKDELNHNIQAAYSPMEHFGIALNYSNIGGFDDPTKLDRNNGNGENVSSVIGEFALGYYLKKEMTTIKEEEMDDEKSVKNFILFDAYGGYGISNIRKSFSHSGSINFDSQYYFLQGGAHYQSKFLGLSYTMRAVVLDYLKGDVNGMLSDSDLAAANSLNSSPFTFLESSFRVQAGREKCRFYFSRNWMMAPFNEKQLDYKASSWNVGIVLDLNALTASPSSTPQ